MMHVADDVSLSLRAAMESSSFALTVPVDDQRSDTASALKLLLFGVDLPGEVFVDEIHDFVGHVACCFGATSAPANGLSHCCLS
jgi:hypothetical protein